MEINYYPSNPVHYTFIDGSIVYANKKKKNSYANFLSIFSFHFIPLRIERPCIIYFYFWMKIFFFFFFYFYLILMRHFIPSGANTSIVWPNLSVHKFTQCKRVQRNPNMSIFALERYYLIKVHRYSSHIYANIGKTEDLRKKKKTKIKTKLLT